jgi:hypothetical protein
MKRICGEKIRQNRGMPEREKKAGVTKKIK